jgi:hypothetical protein
MGMTREQILHMHASARVYQQRFDSAFEPWGMRAKAMTLGEDVDSYRRSLAIQGKRLLPETHKLRVVQYRSLKADAYEVLEPQLLKAVAEHGNRNDSVPFDAPLRQVTETSETGTKITKFLGQRSFVEDFKAIPRRVAYFRTNLGPVKTSGLPVNQ